MTLPQNPFTSSTIPSIKKSPSSSSLEKRDNPNVDRISGLPNDVLLKILKSMPTEKAVQTSLLSKRWEGVWKQMSCLFFVMKNYLMVGVPLAEQSNFIAQLITKVINNHIGNLELCKIMHMTPQTQDRTLPDFLSRTQQQISTIIPMISALTPENSGKDTLRQMISMMPQELQERMLDLVLVYRGLETVHRFLKLYIHRYGLEQGPLLMLPYHPVYPFLTTIEANPVHYRKFPREAYLLLWYLADLYTIGVLFDKYKLLQYLAKCMQTKRKSDYKILYKWLIMFHDMTWWQENIRAQDGVTILVTFRMFNDKNLQDDGMTIDKKYEAQVQLSYNDNPFDGMHFHQRTCGLAVLNGFEESKIDKRLFCPHTVHWHNMDIYPSDFVEEIRQILASFQEQYAWSDANHDHPIYRVEGKRYMIRRYIPGHKIYIPELSDSEEDDM